MPQREIGSELDLNLESTFGRPLTPLATIFRSPEDKLVLTESGRAAIRGALSSIEGKGAKQGHYLVPSYLCEATLQPFIELGLKYHFYPVSEDLRISWEYISDALDSGRYRGLLFIRYFGSSFHTCPPSRFFQRWPDVTVIEDLAQALLTPGVGHIGDYVVYSMRKWLGMPDGGAVVVRDGNAVPTAIEAAPADFFSERLLAFEARQAFRTGYLRSRHHYLARFRRAEEIVERNRGGVFPMSPFSAHIVETSNLTACAAARRRNFHCLLSEFPESEFAAPLPLAWGEDDVPLGFPIVCRQRDWLRRELRNRGIFCPIHWQLPALLAERGGHDGAFSLSRKILTLPCDQRYTKQDMHHLIRTLKAILAIRPNKAAIALR